LKSIRRYPQGGKRNPSSPLATGVQAPIITQVLESGGKRKCIAAVNGKKARVCGKSKWGTKPKSGKKRVRKTRWGLSGGRWDNISKKTRPGRSSFSERKEGNDWARGKPG